MRSIWKYFLPIEDCVTLNIPDGGTVVHVGLQGQNLCLWALVDPSSPKVERVFHVFGTWHSIPDDVGDHLGSFMLMNGAVAGHVFGAR